jgi:DNA topoisomerase-3
MSQTEEGKWRVEFDEPWAKEGAKAPEGEAEASELSTANGKSEQPAPVGQRSAA